MIVSIHNRQLVVGCLSFICSGCGCGRQIHLFLLVILFHADLVDSEKSDLFADKSLFAWTASFLDLGTDVYVSEEVDWTTDHVLS